jgi:hypothetical protein
MIMSKVLPLVYLYCLLLLQEGHAFALPPVLRTVSVISRTSSRWHSDPNSVDSSESSVSSSLQQQQQQQHLPSLVGSCCDDYNNNVDDDLFLLSSPLLPRKRGIRGFFYNRFAGFVTGLVGFVTQGIAAADEYEYAELPPP